MNDCTGSGFEGPAGTAHSCGFIHPTGVGLGGHTCGLGLNPGGLRSVTNSAAGQERWPFTAPSNRMFSTGRGGAIAPDAPEDWRYSVRVIQTVIRGGASERAGFVLISLLTALSIGGCIGNPEERYDWCMMNAASSRGSQRYITAIEQCAEQAFGANWRSVVETPAYKEWLQGVKQEIKDNQDQGLGALSP